MRLMLMMVLMLLAAASHAQPVPLRLRLSKRLRQFASPMTPLKRANLRLLRRRRNSMALNQRANGSWPTRKLARTEANWKQVMGSICTGCVPSVSPCPSHASQDDGFVTKAVSG
jgi:hypothetical protein